MTARGAVTKDFLPWADQRAFNRFLLGDSAIDFDALRRTGYATFDYQLGNFEQQGFKTPTGKVELYSERLATLGLDPLPDHVAPTAERQDDTARAAFR